MEKINYEKDFSYPNPNDPDMIVKLFKKREFYYNKIPDREIIESYEDIQKYRADNCKATKDPKEHQLIIPNFISPNTPYKGILLMYGVGTGKTMACIRIAEQFKEQIKKYNTKIYVLVPGPNSRENFKRELIRVTGSTYLKNKDLLGQMSKADIQREENQAIYAALQYYKILSYKSFYTKVLGNKVISKKLIDNKIKNSYKKNEHGDYDREIVIDKITNMDNSLLIIDEAHNMSGNEYGDALKKIIKNSQNLKLVLLSATPMINLADEIVEILNYIRPLDDQIERDKIFTNDYNYKMKIKPGGLDYLQDKARGYISYYRGSIPYTFAKRVEKGEISNGLLFTPVIKCYMSNFQYQTYSKTEILNDSLDKASSSVSNFVFPGLNDTKNDIIGLHSTEGSIKILEQLKENASKLKELINKKLFNGELSKEEEEHFIMDNEKKNITGLILNIKYIKQFSIKFYKLIIRLSKLIKDKKGPGTAFIYSNLVKAGGIELFAESLKQNGYLEYNENSSNYNIQDNTIDYKTGLTYKYFKKNNMNDFKPAVYLLVTGSGEDNNEELPEVKQKIIQDVFNSYDNTDGKYIKLILGSKVMNESITLKNCKEVHMLEAFYNIPKTEQVIGRVVRMCVHNDVINDNYKFPRVCIYRYAATFSKNIISSRNSVELSIDELLYQKAELKYLVVKDVERVLKEIAIDCPLLLHANVFPEEIEKYKDCVYPTLENIKNKKKICVALCDFTDCNFKCSAKKLNDKYWDDKTKTYINLNKSQIDFNTFNDKLAQNEINVTKNKIKDLFRFKHVYVYEEILNEIKKSFLAHQYELFEEYMLEQAIEDMMPKTENEFNNFTDILYDKYNRPGYLIQREKYFIFQPLNENEEITMYYRQKINIQQDSNISLNNYITQNTKVINIKEDKNITTDIVINEYNFDNDYYGERDENFIVGVIDKNSNSNIDLFKIRPAIIMDSAHKKRGTGIYNFKGSVCTTKEKEYLIDIIKKLNSTNNNEIKKLNDMTKENICEQLKNKLLYLEKYSTTKDGNKKTYIIIPNNHPTMLFPYNLEDRIKFYINKFNKIVSSDTSIKNENKVKKMYNKQNEIYYELIFKNLSSMKSKINDLQKNKFIFNKNNNEWNIIIE